MSNLLSGHAKKLVRREFYMRIVVMCAFAGAAAACAVAALLIPSFIFVSSKLSYAQETRAQENERSGSSYQATVNEINQTNILATHLTLKQGDVSLSDAIAHVERALGPDITMNSLRVTRASDGGYNVSLLGVATTRDALAACVDRLKQDPFITRAVVPFSDLAQARDAAFTADIGVGSNNKP